MHSSPVQIQLSEGYKQKISFDLLTQYGNMTFGKLAEILDVSVEKLHDIHKEHDFLTGSQADDLAQLFLLFLAEHFFQKCIFIRSFVN